MDTSSLLFGVISGFLIGFFLMRIFVIKEKGGIQKRAVQGSRNAIMGEVYEKILPSMPSFPYNPKDMVFIGKGSDYIIFDGLSSGNLNEVIFLELKSGRSRLNKNERMIQNAINCNKVRYTEYRIDSKRNH